MTTGHVFIAASLDGFIAKPDGDIDWLLRLGADGEDHGYGAFIETVDGLIMGRGTYEAVSSFETWPYTKPVVVLSRRLAGSAVPERLAGRVEFHDVSPEQAMASAEARGWRRAYIDGGQVIQAFLREKLIADLVVTHIPILLGAGLRLFGETPGDIDLKLWNSRSFASGFVQSHYAVAS